MTRRARVQPLRNRKLYALRAGTPPRRAYSTFDHAVHGLALVDRVGQHAFLARAHADRLQCAGVGQAIFGAAVADVEHHVGIGDLAVEFDQLGGVLRDAQDLCLGLRWLGRRIDADHAIGAAIGGKADHHAGLRAAGDRAHDDVVELEAEFGLLCTHLFGKADEAQAAQRMLRAAGRDRERLAARLADVFHGLLPARADADVEAGRVQAHVGAQNA